MELHFYPGRKKLIVKDDGKVKWRIEAWGGPKKVGTDPHMAEHPTTAGKYLIHSVKAYNTPTWPMSKIKWGTTLKDMPVKKDVWYKLSSGKWGSIKNDLGISRDEIIQYYHLLYKSRRVPKTWVFNDFGPLAIRYYVDNNNNMILDKNEKLSGEMIHTTPDNEAQTQSGNKVVLAPSHGCIHIKPRDRNLLQGINAFKKGTIFVVHKYNEVIN